MGFSASVRKLGDVTVIDMRGRLTLIEGEAVRELMSDLLVEGNRKLLLNLRGLSYLDSSGIGELVKLYCTVRRRGGDLKVVDLNEKALDIIRLTNLHSVLAEYPDETAAANSFDI